MNRWRNNLVQAICNWLIMHVATYEYRAYISVCMNLGQGRLERRLLDPNDPWHDVGPRRKP